MQNSKSDSSNPTAIKAPQRSSSKISLRTKFNAVVKSPRDSSPPGRVVREDSSMTSMGSRPTDFDSEDSTAKLRTKFTQPRMNRITELRLKRLQTAQTNGSNNDCQLPMVASPRAKRKIETTSAVQVPAATVNNESGDKAKDKSSTPSPQQAAAAAAAAASPVAISSAASSPTAPQLDTMLDKLADLQSDFMQHVKHLRQDGQPISCKFVTMVQNEQCQLVLHKEDLLSLPKNIPAKSVGDLKALCRKTFDGTIQPMFEDLYKDVAAGGVKREQLRSKMQENLQSKVELINAELSKLCCAGDKADTPSIVRSNEHDRLLIDQLRGMVCKLEGDVGDTRKSRDEFKKSLDAVQKKNTDLAIELADKNIKGIEQAVLIDDLRNEIKVLKHTNKLAQQRVKDIESSQDQAKELTCSQMSQLQKQLDQALAEKQAVEARSEELAKSIAAKDQQLIEMQKQLAELAERHKDWQSVHSEQSSHHEANLAQINELKAKLAVNQNQFAAQVKVEQSLREQVHQKQKQLNEMESKVSQLEESLVHHRKMNDVRSERIVHLDKEIKQREQENIRKLNEVMLQSSDKNAIITQITNELASTNEQFQNLCATLSIKQTKLHSQEHVIKLLEESNARSVKLHTKLGEKNALLKDELEHLRRTVNNLMLGSDGADADGTDILVG